jgi:hypothetical protein
VGVLAFGVLLNTAYWTDPWLGWRQAREWRAFLDELRGKTDEELRSMVLDSDYFTLTYSGALRDQPAIARFLHRFSRGDYAAIIEDLPRTGDFGAGFAECERAIGMTSRPEILDYGKAFDAVVRELRRRAMGLA